jgi:hypothetical protein
VIPGSAREGWAEDEGEKKKPSARATELTTSPVGSEMRGMGEDRAKRDLALEESLENLEKEGIVGCMRARLRKRRGGWIAWARRRRFGRSVGPVGRGLER